MPLRRCTRACLWGATSSTTGKCGLARRGPRQSGGCVRPWLPKLQRPHGLLLPGVRGRRVAPPPGALGSTAWYQRTTCSPAPWSTGVTGVPGAGLGVFSPTQQDLSSCSPGTSGKESGPSPSCPPRARNKDPLNPTRVSASPLGQEAGVQCPGRKAPHFHPGPSRALVGVQLLSRV